MKKIAQGRARRAARQKQAQERAAVTTRLSIKDRKDAALMRPGESRRELARLNKALGAETAAKDASFKKIHAAPTKTKTAA
jgi:hypothetical protein